MGVIESRGATVVTISRFNRDLILYGWPVAITFVLGLLLTLSLTQRVDDAEARLAQSRFAQVAQHHIQLLDELFYNQFRELDALRRFITLEPRLSRKRFYDLSNLPLRFKSAVGWVENVPRSQLDRFLARMKEEYGPSFRLHVPPDSDNQAGEDEVRLYPVTYLNTLLRNGYEIGANVRLLPDRRAAFDRAMASAGAVLLPQPPRKGQQLDDAGVMLIVPVFQPGTGLDVTQRHFGNLRGFVYLHVQLASLAQAAITPSPGQQAMARQQHSGIHLIVNDVTQRESPEHLYTSAPGIPLPDIRFSQELNLADHSFRVTAFPSHPQDWSSGPTATIVLASGLAGSLLVSGYLASLLLQRQRSDRLVARRTRQLQEANAYRSGLLASAVDVAVVATDVEGTITLFSAGAENLLGYRAEDMVGKATPLAFHDPVDLQRWQQRLTTRLGYIVPEDAIYAAAIEAGYHKSQHWVCLHRNGEARQVQLTLSTIRSDDERVLGYLSVGVDLTDYVRAMEALEHSDQLLRDLSAEVPGVIYQFALRTDGRSYYTFISKGVENIFEVTAEEALNHVDALYRRVHPDDRESFFRELEYARDHLAPWLSEFRVQLPQQGIRWLRGEAHHRRLEDGSLISNGYITDITALKDLEFQLREQATVDPLTKAFNRRHLHTQWQQAVARYRRTGVPLSLIMLDIDHFKQINDTHGHDAGDEVLVRLSWLLSHEIRSTDVVYRLGGEEFLIVCEDTDLQGAKTLAKSLQRKLRASAMPFVGHITASFSVTEVKPNEDMDSAFKRLDDLLYRAKRGGRDCIVNSEPPSRRSSDPEADADS